MDAPQEVVGELLRRRHLERGDRAALRVERGHHVAQRPVLAGRVDPLEDDEDLVLALGPEPVLEVGQPVEARVQLRRGRLLRVAEGLGRVDLREIDAGAGSDAERVAQRVAPDDRAIGCRMT